MKNIDKNKLIEIVNSLMFNPTEEVLQNILSNWKDLQDSLEYFNYVDLSELKPLTHINEDYNVDFFREDIVDSSYSIDKETILENAKEKDSDYVILTKVVK